MKWVIVGAVVLAIIIAVTFEAEHSTPNDMSEPVGSWDAKEEKEK